MLGERKLKKKKKIALNLCILLLNYEGKERNSVFWGVFLLFEKLKDETHLALACLPKLLVDTVASKVFTKQILRLEIYKRNKSLHVKRKPCSSILCIMHLKPVRVLAAVDWEIKLGADDSDRRVTPGWCAQPSLSFYSVALGFFCGVEGV